MVFFSPDNHPYQQVEALLLALERASNLDRQRPITLPVGSIRAHGRRVSTVPAGLITIDCCEPYVLSKGRHSWRCHKTIPNGKFQKKLLRDTRYRPIRNIWPRVPEVPMRDFPTTRLLLATADGCNGAVQKGKNCKGIQKAVFEKPIFLWTNKE